MATTFTSRPEKEILINYKVQPVKNIFICHAPSNSEVSKREKEQIEMIKRYFKSFAKRILGKDFKIYNSDLTPEQKSDAINISDVFIIITGSEISSELKKEIQQIQFKYIESNQCILVFKIITDKSNAVNQIDDLVNIREIKLFEDEKHLQIKVSQLNDKGDQVNHHKQDKIAELVYEVEKYYQKTNRENSHIEPNVKVYLAETTADQTGNREIIKREIEQFGYQVLPESMLPENAEDFKKTVESDLKKSSLSVHIIGQDYGEIPKGEVHSFVDIQNKLASVINREQYGNHSKFVRLIWLPPDLKIKSDLQKIYIEKLKRDFAGLNDAEFLQIPIETLKTIIINKLKALKFGVSRESEQIEGKPKIYIIHEKHDKPNVQPIAEWLLNNNFEPVTSVFSDKGINTISKHRQLLVECDFVIIYKSGYNQSWFSSKIFDLLKAPGYGKTKPFSAKVILLDQNANGLDKEMLKGFIILHIQKDISVTMQAFQEHLKLKNE